MYSLPFVFIIFILSVIVVERLVTKGHYEVMGHSFKLSRFSKEPDPLEAVLLEVNPGNTLVLHNVPNDVEDEHLCLFLGSACGLDDEEDFKISRKEGSPVILMSLVDRLKGKFFKLNEIGTSAWVSSSSLDYARGTCTDLLIVIRRYVMSNWYVYNPDIK